MLRNKKSSAELEGWSWVAILNRMVTEKVTFEQSVKGASQGGKPYLGEEHLRQKEEPVQRP